MSIQTTWPGDHLGSLDLHRRLERVNGHEEDPESSRARRCCQRFHRHWQVAGAVVRIQQSQSPAVRCCVTESAQGPLSRATKTHHIRRNLLVSLDKCKVGCHCSQESQIHKHCSGWPVWLSFHSFVNFLQEVSLRH